MTSYEAGQANQGIPDEDVLTFATQNERAVITLNRDDFITLHSSGYFSQRHHYLQNR
ncbi:MAG: DUF5615 family PIN-like protein [Nostoc sp.]|uniref:DUF5615 family PIN-like protein n=1 Tax=Nostoc sp. TaxID=1180 RepID=UPI002FF68F1C